jgi:hypothetical protein
LGIVDNDSKSKFLPNEDVMEKELLLCVRPVIKEKHLKYLSRMPVRTSNANDSEESTQNKVSSGSDNAPSDGSNKSHDLGYTGAAREAQLCKRSLPKKRKVGVTDEKVITGSSSTVKKVCIEGQAKGKNA